MSRIFLLIAALGALFVGGAQLTEEASASGWEEYDEAAFMMAQKKGRTIVVAIATGSPQKAPSLDRVLDQPLAADALFMTVEYDSESEFVGAHGIEREPTILVFEGMNEIARSQGREPQNAVLGAL